MTLTQLGYSQDYYYKNNTRITLEKVHIQSGIGTQNIEYYKNENGTLLGVIDKVIAKTADIKLLKNYARELNITIEKKLAENLYLLKTKGAAETLSAANVLSKKEGLEYAHPDFIKKRMSR